jgi:hypothetical protein
MGLLVEIILLLQSMSGRWIEIKPGIFRTEVEHPIKFMNVHWGYITRLRRSCKALSRIFYSEAESRIWSRVDSWDFPAFPRWFVHEALKQVRKASHVPWCDLTHRPEWERMRRAVGFSMIFATVTLRMKGSKPFQEDHYLQMFGLDFGVFRLRRRQLAFRCPPDHRCERNNMPLCKNLIEEPKKTEENEENEEEKEKKVEPENVILVDHMSITTAGKLVVWLHDSVWMWRGNKCPNGNPIIGVGESFSAGVRIKEAWLAFDFQLTMQTGHL